MKRHLWALAVAGLVGMVLALSAAARADDDNDHDRARELYEHGEIHALQDILRDLRHQAPGEVISVDLVRLGERWFYRFQVIAPDGRRTTVDIDAGSDREIDEGDDD